MNPLLEVQAVLGPDAWWSVTEGRDGCTWIVGVEGKDRHACVQLGCGGTLADAIADAQKLVTPARHEPRLRVVR